MNSKVFSEAWEREISFSDKTKDVESIGLWKFESLHNWL